MASLSCCTTRQPPSPDGPPPRPVESPSKLPAVVPNDYLLEKPWSAISSLPKPEDIIVFQDVLEDKSDTDDEDHNLKAKKSSSTLSAMKTRLRHHLSRDTAFSKRQSRSVGTSEEEVERRKELKRLNHRRIQEELSNEGVYDEDAESLSTIAATNNVLMNPSTTTPPLIPFLSSSNGITKPAYSQISRAGDSFHPLYLLKRRSHAWIADQNRPSTTVVPTLQRRHSSVELCRHRIPSSNLSDWAPQSQSSSHLIPPAPVLKPQRLPSIADSVSRRTSWRLSFASDTRSSQLRALIQEHKDSEMSTDCLGKKSGSFQWLWGQGMRMSSQSMTDPSENSNNLEAPASHSALCNEGKGFGGVDGNAETNTPHIHLHEMRISQRLASRDLYSHSSSPQLSSWDSRGQHERPLHTSGDSHEKGSRQSGSQRNESISDSAKPNILSSRDEASSFYSAGHRSMQSTSETSWFNLPSLLAPGKSESTDQKHDSKVPIVTVVPRKSIADIAPKGNSSTTILNAPLAREHRQLTANSCSIARETTRFRERKTELNLMETGHPKFMNRQALSIPVQSKFREEFGELPTASQSKSPIMSALRTPKMTKSVSRGYDGSGSIDLQIPGQRHGYGYTFTNRGPSTPGLVGWTSALKTLENSGMLPVQTSEKSAEELWTRALMRRQEERVQQISDQALRKRELEKKRESRRSFMAIRSLSWKLRGKSTAGIGDTEQEGNERPLAPDEQDEELERIKRLEVQRVERESENIAAWATELRYREEEARTKSVAVRGRPQKRAITTLESWARFPSHTRSERNEAAGLSDNVSQHDFAIKNNKDGEIEWVTGERKHHHHHDAEKKHHSNLPARLSKQLRASLYKLRTSKSSLVNDALHGRKSSISIGGTLEFPELEILPSTDNREGEMAEMEREVAEELRQKERTSRMFIFNDGGQDYENEGRKLSLGDTTKLSIADPKFYEDCLFTSQPTDLDDNDLKSEVAVVTVRLEDPPHVDKGSLKVQKNKTWNGRHGPAMHSIGSMALRRSTAEFKISLEDMELLGRDRAIRSAEKAWGR